MSATIEVYGNYCNIRLSITRNELAHCSLRTASAAVRDGLNVDLRGIRHRTGHGDGRGDDREGRNKKGENDNHVDGDFILKIDERLDLAIESSNTEQKRDCYCGQEDSLIHMELVYILSLQTSRRGPRHDKNR
jgi:hypothetical protein